MTAKATLDLIKRVYRLIELYPADFCPEDGSTYAEKLLGCESLLRAAGTLQRWAEKACNGVERYDAKAGMRLASWTDADEAAKDKAQGRAEKKALAALAMMFGDKLAGLDIEFQRDPRGAMVKVYRKSLGGRSGNPDLWV